MEEVQKLSAEELKRLREELKKETRTSSTSAPLNTADTGVTATDTDATDTDTGENKEEELVSTKSVTVTVSEDKMKAEVYLTYPAIHEQYTVEEVIAALRDNKVVLGISTEVIEEIIKLGHFEEDMVIAEGKDVTQGTEGYFEFLVPMEERKEPLIREDGTVDYTSMGKLTNVASGDKIAIYHSAVQGTKGFTVTGQELSPKYCKDLPPLRGQHIECIDDEYFAKIDGRISCSNNNVTILTVYEINDDLDMTNGVVEFFGDIIINGNVESGVVIRAGRNIMITGTVSSARINAGGDITLQRGIQGGDVGKISARGSIFAEFIEYANVDAQGDIHANYLLGSNVRASGKVFVDGSKGSVIGGYVHGLKGVELRNSGTPSEPKTYIHAGFPLDDYQKFATLGIKEKKLNGDLAMIVSEMSDLLKIGRERGVNQAQKDRIFKLNEMKDEINASLDKLSDEKKELGMKMAQAAGSCIIARGDVYRNTTIGIDAVSMPILCTETCIKYVCKNDVIERRTVPR